jgi:hypothetical protein
MVVEPIQRVNVLTARNSPQSDVGNEVTHPLIHALHHEERSSDVKMALSSSIDEYFVGRVNIDTRPTSQIMRARIVG